MFTSFSNQFYRRCVEREYHPVLSGLETQSVAETDHWLLQKTEKASLCLLQVVDCQRCDLKRLRENRDAWLARMASEPNERRNIIALFVLVSETTLQDEAQAKLLQAFTAQAEGFYGQPVYCVYWQVRLQEQTCTAMPGQPNALFGLEGLIKAAMLSASDTEAATFLDIKEKAIAETPYAPRQEKAWLSYGLIAVNAWVLVLMYLNGFAADDTVAIQFGAIVPEAVYAGAYYRLFTAMFVHFGWIHFLHNSAGLLIFGVRAERYFGRIRFLIIYGIAGLGGSVASLWFSRAFAAGASGAIYGLVGAVFAYTGVSGKSVDRLDHYIMLIFIISGLAFGFMTPNVDNFGHIGGLLTGMLLGWGLMKTLYCGGKTGMV